MLRHGRSRSYHDEGPASSLRVLCSTTGVKARSETSVTTAIFPAWFAYLFAEANGISTKVLGSDIGRPTPCILAAVMVGALLVAICAPSLGVIADRRMIKICVAENPDLPRCRLLYLAGASRPTSCIVMGWIWRV